MTIYSLNSSSIQKIHEADLIHPRLICSDNENYQYSKEREFELHHRGWGGFAWKGRNGEGIPADRDANVNGSIAENAGNFKACTFPSGLPWVTSPLGSWKYRTPGLII